MIQNTLSKTADPFFMIYNTSEKKKKRFLGIQDATVTMTSNFEQYIQTMQAIQITNWYDWTTKQ